MGNTLSIPEFIETINRSELISATPLDDILAQCRRDAAPPKDSPAIARRLIRAGMLTPFQAKLLLQGRWRNFFLAGKYKVLDHIGSGGMGTVYLCEHRHMRRRVAVKLLPPEKTNPEALSRFHLEAQAVALMDHPNIVRAFDIDHEGTVPFLVMEFIDGISFQKLVDGRGAMPLDRSVHYLVQTALGLQHAHESGLVHRDVKPSNLMLDWSGTVKLLDLGLARFFRSADRATQGPTDKVILGTADYLAPEQAISSTVDHRADIYALGAVAFFFMAGRPVFDGGSIAQKLFRHQTETPVRLDTIHPEIPSDVADLVARMLAKDPADRPASAIDVVDALSPHITHVAPPSPDEMPPSRYGQSRDIDTKAKHSTIAMMSVANRALLNKTMVAAMS